MSYSLPGNGPKRFTEKEPNTPFNKGDDCCEKLYELETCKPLPTNQKIAEGPLCGLAVFFVPKTGECVYFDKESGSFVPTDAALEPCVAGDVVDCVVGGSPERWCVDVSNLSGNGNESSVYELTTAAGDAVLPVDYVASDIADAMGDGFYLDGDFVCSDVADFSIALKSRIAAGEPPDVIFSLSAVSIQAQLEPAVEGVVYKAAITKGFNDDAIIEAIENISIDGSDNTEVIASLEALCTKLETLISVSNDATALAAILTALEAVCEKLLSQAEQNQAICDKLEAMIASLVALCEKIESGNADILAELESIKACLTDVLAAIEEICTKLDALNASAAAICDKLDTANTALLAVCDKLDALLAAVVAVTAAIDLLKECNTAENEAICAKLEALLEQGATEAECLDAIKLALADLKACNTAENQAICEKLESVIVDAPACAGTAIGTPVTYTNTDITTEMTVSVGDTGDIKIDAGGGDGSESEITDYITVCLAAGNNVSMTYVDTAGVAGSATLLAVATTNPFPNFYNQSTDAVGGLGKVQTMTATCLSVVAEPGKAIGVTDPCALEKLCDISGLLATLVQIQTASFEKLCEISDKLGPCEEVCDVTGFLTPAQAEYTIVGPVMIGSEDVSAKFALPVDGNVLPDLQAFQETLVACLESRGYPVEVIQGRDGWTINYTGEITTVGTEGAANVTFDCI